MEKAPRPILPVYEKDPRYIWQLAPSSVKIAVASCSSEAFATITMDGRLRVWSLVTGELAFSSSHLFLPYCCSFSRVGGCLLTSNSSNQVALIDPRSHLHRVYTGHTSSVRCVTLTDDGLWIFSGSSSGDVAVWHVSEQASCVFFAAHVSTIRHCCVSPDNHMLVTSADDGSIKLWACILASGTKPSVTLKRTLKHHEVCVSSVVLLHDMLIAGSLDGRVSVCDVDRGVVVHELVMDGPVLTVQFIPKTSSVCVVCVGGVTHIFDPSKWVSLRRIHIPGIRFTSASITYSGQYLCFSATRSVARAFGDGPDCCVLDIRRNIPIVNEDGFIQATGWLRLRLWFMVYFKSSGVFSQLPFPLVRAISRYL